MKARTKKILNFALIFGTLAIVLAVGVSGQEMSGALEAIRSVAPMWIVLCLLAYLLYAMMDALAVFQYVRTQGYPISLPYALYIAIVGAYYSNITPGATGGQPMQIYYMTKRKVPIGIGTSALTVKLFCFQFLLMVFGTALWIVNREFVARQLGGNLWILIVGYVYNDFTVCLILMIAVNKRLVWWVIRQCIRLGARMRLCKNPDASTAKWEEALNAFHDSIMSLRQRPVQLLIQMAIAAAQLLSLMTVTYLIYRAFGLKDTGYWHIITLAVMLYTSAAYTPLPGASGAQEGVFALYYASVFPDGIRLMALLMWRFFTYYISLILGAVVTVWQGLRSDKDEKPTDAVPEKT